MDKFISDEELIKDILYVGDYILKRASDVVAINKGDDDKYYKEAVLTMANGRKMSYQFNTWKEKPDIIIDNYYWDEKQARTCGDSFSILSKDGNGFIISINLCFLDRDNILLIYGESFPFRSKLSSEEKKVIIKYLEKLYEQVHILKYDKFSTQTVNNLTSETKKVYNMYLFEDEMKKLKNNNSEDEILPSVKIAVDWWTNELVRQNINEEQIEKFKEELTMILMNKLKNGLEPQLLVDYGASGLLYNAIYKAGIKDAMLPIKTSMIVTPDSVKMRVGYSTDFEEIFGNKENKIKKFFK